MIFIKRFLFIIAFSCIYCYIGYNLFSEVFQAKSVIITYGINPFDICVDNPELWRYIKITFFVTYIFSSFIIAKFVYFILSIFVKNVITTLKKISEKMSCLSGFGKKFKDVYKRQVFV